MLGVLLGNWRVTVSAAALAGALGFGGCWWLRDQMGAHKQLQAARVEVRYVHQIEYRDRQAQGISDKAGAAVEQSQAAIRIQYRDKIREVVRYVTPAADARCIVPVGFVRDHDAAASGSAVVPDATGRTDDAGSGVDLSAVAQTVDANYGVCHETADRLTRLQSWVRDEAALAAQPLRDAPKVAGK